MVQCRGVVSCGLKECGVVWCRVVRYGPLRCGVVSVYCVVSSRTDLYDDITTLLAPDVDDMKSFVALCGVVCRDRVVWCSVVLCPVIWCCMVSIGRVTYCACVGHDGLCETGLW